MRDAAEAQVFSDVDSAYVTLVSALNLLRPYKAKYLQLAADSRDTDSLSRTRTAARRCWITWTRRNRIGIRGLAYLNLIGSYLTAAAQMNMAVGREVIPMNRTILSSKQLLCLGCELSRRRVRKEGDGPADPDGGTGPPPAQVEPDMDANNFKVDHPEQFPLATAGEHVAAPELNVTGVVSPGRVAAGAGAFAGHRAGWWRSTRGWATR